MPFQPIFVPEGVYLRTSSGEIVGRLDRPDAPFATLTDAEEHADWLDMVAQHSALSLSSEPVMNAKPSHAYGWATSASGPRESSRPFSGSPRIQATH